MHCGPVKRKKRPASTVRHTHVLCTAVHRLNKQKKSIMHLSSHQTSFYSNCNLNHVDVKRLCSNSWHFYNHLQDTVWFWRCPKWVGTRRGEERGSVRRIKSGLNQRGLYTEVKRKIAERGCQWEGSGTQENIIFICIPVQTNEYRSWAKIK